MEPPPPAGTDGSESLKVRDRSSAAEERHSASDIAPSLVDREDPLLGSRLVVPRSVSVIRPPSFSLRTIVSGMTTLFGYRDLLCTLTFFRLAVRYKQSVLGWIWGALQPLSLMIIYTLIFSRVARVTSEGMPYPLFVFSGLLPWIFFASAVSNAINGLIHYPALLTKMYFPREIIPLSYVLAALVDFAIACVILTGLMMYYRVSLSWNALYALPIIAILSAFTVAIAMFLSSIQVRFRDVGVGLPLLLQIGVLAAPVVYPLSSVSSRYQRLYLLNPVASLIENFRRVVLHGSGPDFGVLITSGAISLCCLVLAYGYFKATESTMADMI
jgi:homopolymeric O-antigen transport system permease protein